MARLAWVSALGLLTLCLAASADAQRGEPQGGRGARPGQLGGAVTAHYPPVFFREDWKYDSSVPNQNNEREPEHTIVQSDVKNPNLEVRLYGDKAGTRTVIQMRWWKATMTAALRPALEAKASAMPYRSICSWSWAGLVSRAE